MIHEARNLIAGHERLLTSIVGFMKESSLTLSVEKIPVVLRPVIKLPVKSMASIGTQEKSGNLGI